MSRPTPTCSGTTAARHRRPRPPIRAARWHCSTWRWDHGRLELMKFHAPPARGGDRHAPANTLGIRRIAFAVDDIDAAVAGL
jgi:hypothetical protein